MIKVLFPPGCHGTFLTKCLYKLTSLNSTYDHNFKFDEFGSSHDFRHSYNKHLINCGHLETTTVMLTDKVVVVVPCEHHQLDYFDNQFWKQEKKQICSYLYNLYDSDDIQLKLLQHWNYSEKLNNNTPTWILREWCSFWLNDCLNNGYNVNKYRNIGQAISITTQDIIENLPSIIFMLAKQLSLTVTVSESQIAEIQKTFVHNQRLHGIQKKCYNWVDDIIEGRHSESPCLTIFDEAFVQHLLRQRGYNIQCNELNLYPTNASELNKIIYRA